MTNEMHIFFSLIYSN